MNGKALQAGSDTGAGNTQSTVDLEQRIVGRALDESLVEIEKLVLLPFQIGAGVWAAVDVGMEGSIAVYHEDIQRRTLEAELKRTAARIPDV